MALPRADDHGAVRRQARGVRRADLRPRSLLDGQRGHHQRDSKSAGFEEIALRRCDLPILIGRDIDEAVEFVMSLGPAGEILRLAGDRAAHLHEPVAEALREGLAEWAGPDGASWARHRHGSSRPLRPAAKPLLRRTGAQDGQPGRQSPSGLSIQRRRVQQPPASACITCSTAWPIVSWPVRSTRSGWVGGW